MRYPQLLLWALIAALVGLYSVRSEAKSGKAAVATLPASNGGKIVGKLSIAEEQTLGRQIYLEGKLPNGKPLIGKRMGNITISANQAACVNCHRPSGLGGAEGAEVVPPITGKALFGGEPVIVEVDQRSRRGLSTPSVRHDDKAFAAAVRLGKHVSGRNLQPLMPRYDLSDQELQAVAAYLRTLSTSWSPGASQSEIHLATVITPEVGSERRKALVDTLNAMLNQHNVNVHAGGHHKVPTIERRMNSRRTWSLDVWELSGPSSTWREQLEGWQRQKPAFAILSGVSDGEWQPVQDFCEANKVACWFPSVDAVPESAKNSQYSLYFSAGVGLEAEVIAKRLLTAEKKPGRVLQIVGSGFVAQQAAMAGHKLFDKPGVAVQELVWRPDNVEPIKSALTGLAADDAVLVWLGGDELQALQNAVSAPVARVFLSSTLVGEGPRDSSSQWLQNSWLVQRFELAKLRAANLQRFNDWIKYRQLPLVDERMQSEAFFAFSSFSWIASSMLNNLYTDYLIERAEATLSMRDAMQVQEEVQSMMMGGGGRRPSVNRPVANAVSEQHVVDIQFLRKRESTSIYPRLTLGNGQRFASKGAYLRKLSVSDDAVDWLVP